MSVSGYRLLLSRVETEEHVFVCGTQFAKVAFFIYYCICIYMKYIIFPFFLCPVKLLFVNISICNTF